MAKDTSLGLFNLFKQSNSTGSKFAGGIPDRIQVQSDVGNAPMTEIPDKLHTLYSGINDVMKKNHRP